ARLPAGRQQDGTAILPGGRRVTPSGAQLDVGGFPIGLRALPGGKHVVVTDGSIDDEFLSVVDVAAQKVVQREPFTRAAGKSLFYGLAVRADGHLFVSGGGDDTLVEYAYAAAAGQPRTGAAEHDLVGSSYVSGLAFVDDHRLLAGYQQAQAVALIDTDSGSELARISFAPGEPYDIVVDAAAERAYVSLWGADDVAVL